MPNLRRKLLLDTQSTLHIAAVCHFNSPTSFKYSTNILYHSQMIAVDVLYTYFVAYTPERTDSKEELADKYLISSLLKLKLWGVWRKFMN